MRLRNLILVAVCGWVGFTFTPNATADEDGGAASTQLQNLVFYPHQGQFVWAPKITGSLQDGNKAYNVSGIQTSYSRTSTEDVSATLSYGVFDRFRLALTETWLVTDNESNTNLTKGTVTTESSHGPSNPTLSATYRYVEPKGDGVHADVGFSVVPALGTKQGATTDGQTGNDNGGAWNSSLSLPVYWVSGHNELGGVLAVTHYFGGVANGTIPSNTTVTEPYWLETVTLEDRIHLTHAFYVQPDVVFYLPYSYDSATQATGATETAHAIGFYMSPELDLGYLIGACSLLDFTVQYSNDTNSAYPTSGKYTQTTTTELLASLQARFLF